VWGQVASTGNSSAAVLGTSIGTTGTHFGVAGINFSATGVGVLGSASATGGTTSLGLQGQTTTTGTGSTGSSGLAGGTSGVTYGMVGQTNSTTNSARGLFGLAAGTTGTTYGFWGASNSGVGVGVVGNAIGAGASLGLQGQNTSTTNNAIGSSGLAAGATGRTYGVYGQSNSGNNTAASGVYGFAAVPAVAWGIYTPHWLGGGTKAFFIDHPLDPENKYLTHYCSEGHEPLNVYSGNIKTDANGLATVTLPAYVEGANTDFRYQLTCMGQLANAVIKEKLQNNRFVILTDKPNVEVSWQLSGVRNDPTLRYLIKGRPVEMAKDADARGKYLLPQAYGFGLEKSITQPLKYLTYDGEEAKPEDLMPGGKYTLPIPPPLKLLDTDSKPVAPKVYNGQVHTVKADATNNEQKMIKLHR
jgi:hypothetical protein